MDNATIISKNQFSTHKIFLLVNLFISSHISQIGYFTKMIYGKPIMLLGIKIT